MKKVVGFFIIVVILMISFSSIASYCPVSPNGEHFFSYYKDAQHNVAGHRYYRVCEECGVVEELGYVIDYTCCLCVGHNYSSWITPSITHYDQGHLTSRTCTRCSYTQYDYVYDFNCCQCTNDHDYMTIVSDIHTASGHLVTEVCTSCGESNPVGYTIKTDCCLCGFHTYTNWSTPSITHYTQGHKQIKTCTKCGDTLTRYVIDYSCCECTNNHAYVEKISSIHTSNGHKVYEECIYCGEKNHIGYTTIEACCCGVHIYGDWQTPSVLHTYQGHVQQRVCQLCGEIEKRYVIDENCCSCSGHNFGEWSPLGDHTNIGHESSRLCLRCGYEEKKYLVDFNCDLCRGEPVNSTEFLRWLQSRGIPAWSSGNMYQANFATYSKYGLIVYGWPGQVANNELKDGEYRYLGFTYLNDYYTNMYFPNDYTSGIPPELWTFVPVNGAMESYDLLEQTVQKPYMLSTLLVGHGATTLTTAQIGMDKAKVQSGATWSNAGSIYTEKDTGNYATFIVPSMGYGNLTATLTPSKSVLSFTPGVDQIEIVLTLSASIDKPSNEIDYFKGSITSNPLVTSYATNQIEITKTIVINRPMNDYEEISFNAYIELESIFGDRLEKDIYCTIALHIMNDSGGEPPTDPPPPVDEDAIDIEGITLYGAYNHWTNEYDILGNELPYHEHRFMSLEKIFVRIQAKNIKRVLIRFSLPLESMQYTSTEGIFYDYYDDFGISYVTFPGDSIFYFQDETIDFTFSYIIPMCPETITMDNQRLRIPYTLYIELVNGDESVVYTITDIDITGTVYDLLYPQPGR